MLPVGALGGNLRQIDIARGLCDLSKSSGVGIMGSEWKGNRKCKESWMLDR